MSNITTKSKNVCPYTILDNYYIRYDKKEKGNHVVKRVGAFLSQDTTQLTI